MSEEKQNNQMAMELIIEAGNAKTAAMQAIHVAKKDNFEQAHNYLQEANQALNKAHLIQKDMFSQQASDTPVSLNLYLIHAQDHLMTAITFIDLAQEIIALYQKLASKK